MENGERPLGTKPLTLK